MNIQQAPDEETQLEKIDTDTKLAFLKHLSEVESQIKENISKDFVLAHLNEQDKTGIIEMSSNAYFAASIIQTIKEKSQTTGTWHWNKKNKNWEKHDQNPNITKKITQIQTKLFTTYMRRLYMVAILARNHSQNHMLNVLATSVSGVQHITEEEKEKEREANKLKEFVKAVSKNEQQPQN